MRLTTGEQLREMAKLLPRYEVTTENADVFRARIAELERQATMDGGLARLALNAAKDQLASAEAALDKAQALNVELRAQLKSQKPVPNVHITDHLDEIDAPVWEFINAEARKLGPITGSIDNYGLSRPNGGQPNGGVAVLWNGPKIHAVALTVRDARNRTRCIRLLNAHPPAAQANAELVEALIGEANTILEIGESINPGCVLHSEIKAALAKKELSDV